MHDDIKAHNQSITDQYKSNLKSKSEEILEQLLKFKDTDKIELSEETTSIVVSFLDENALVEMNQEIHNHFRNFLITIYGNFSEALSRRDNIASIY